MKKAQPVHATTSSRGRLALLLLLLLATPAEIGAQCPGVPSQDTYVDPTFVDCTGTRAWNGTTAGGAIFGAPITMGAAADFDGDGRSGAMEDGDMDAVYGTIGTALACTLPGGTVHVLVPGVYRGSLTVTQSVTVRGLEGQGVVLDGTWCNGAGGFGVGVTVTAGSGRLENLVIRGHPLGGIVAQREAELLKLVRCRVEDNGQDGISSSTSTELVETEVLRNEWIGVNVTAYAPVAVSIVRSVVAANKGIGIQFGTSNAGTSCRVEGSQVVGNGRSPLGSGLYVATQSYMPITVSGSVLSGNTADGIFTAGKQYHLSVTDCDVSMNGQDGVHALATGTNAAHVSYVVVQDSRMTSNGSDGFEALASNDQPPTSGLQASINRNVFASNGQIGVNASTNAVTINCFPGFNQVSFNVVANEVPANCAGFGTNQMNGRYLARRWTECSDLEE